MTILKDIALYVPRPLSASRVELVLENKSRSIMSNICNYLRPRIRTDGYWRIAIMANGKSKLRHLKSVGGVLYYNVDFDIGFFMSKNVAEQKEMLLSFILKTLNHIFLELNLDGSRLNGVGDYVISRDFKNTFKGPKSKRGDISAQTVCIQEFEKANVFLTINKGRREIERHYILTTSPNEFIFMSFLEQAIWLSDDKLVLYASGEEFFFERQKNSQY